VDNIYLSFVEYYKKSLRAELNRLADDLASDNCQTIEQYKQYTGMIRGIMYAEQVFEELVKQLQEKE
jgi:hypothetical protein